MQFDICQPDVFIQNIYLISFFHLNICSERTRRQQHKHLSFSQQIAVEANDESSQRGLMSLQEMMFKHQQHFEKRRLSENDVDRDIKLPKLSPIENNTCSSVSPLSLCGMSPMSGMRANNAKLHPTLMSGSFQQQTSNDKSMNLFLNHREKAQNQQSYE
jgi:hypothetical protein